LGISRRTFLNRVGQAGGLGAAWTTLRALGLMAVPSAYAGPPQQAPEAGRGIRVAILGAGIAGLVAAHELGKAGYECLVLEAADRPGGRNRTLRRGDRLTTLDGVTQVCDFSDGQYCNAGAARLPSTHAAILAYCRALGVALEVEVATNRHARVTSPDLAAGAVLEQRQVHADTRGLLAELLAKAASHGALDRELSAADREGLLDFLQVYAGLSPELRYRGSATALDLSALLTTSVWDKLLTEENSALQPTLLQPVGGMDRIPQALAQTLREPVRYGAIVETLRNTPEGVVIGYREATGGARRSMQADYCICTLPLPVLATLDTNLAADMRAAVAAVPYEDASKLAWEAPRFWEREAQLYGGTSYVAGETAVCWYPSDRFHAPTGILIGAYTMGWVGRRFAARSFAAQCESSRAAIERLHPGHGRDLTKPLIISWSKLANSRGAWAMPPPAAEDPVSLRRLREPEGRLYLAGEHVSDLPGWQEGAVLAAHRVVRALSARSRV
jgi:monoamine oxidase